MHKTLIERQGRERSNLAVDLTGAQGCLDDIKQRISQPLTLSHPAAGFFSG